MKKLIVCSASVLLFIGVITVSLQKHQPAATDNLAARNAAALAQLQDELPPGCGYETVVFNNPNYTCYGVARQRCGTSPHNRCD